MITVLNFSKLNTYPIGVVTLDFAANDEPIPPLIDWGRVGNVVNLAFDPKPVRRCADLSFGYSATRLGADYEATYRIEGRTVQDFIVINNRPDILWSYIIVANLTKVLLTTQIYIGWETGELTWAAAGVAWGRKAGYTNINSNIVWNAQPLSHSITVATHFITPQMLWITQHLGYIDFNKAESVIHAVWGVHKPRWICSSSAPMHKGTVVLRFNAVSTFAKSKVTLTFVAEPEVCYYDDGGGLIDSGGSLPNFDFKIPIEPQIRRVYLMQPQLTCVRVSDGTPIIIYGVSFSDSRGQFTKSVSIDFSSKGDADLAMNQLLLITINGYEFYAVPEELTRRQSFNSIDYSATGRSRTAQIAAPWRLPISYSNATDRTLGGILADILDTTGWSATLVGFSDFNVPAKVFSIFGKAPIESVSEIAAMIGCMIVADEELSTLNILPKWPVTPWNIATEVADINIHDAVIISYNSQDQINQLCNAAWVRGENDGVSRHVRVTGTAGDVPTADVANALIVADIPARLLGTSLVADTGRKQRITVTLPIMNDLPPLSKGMTIGVNYFGEVFKTTCDSVSISATVDSGGAIDVVQSVNLIRHME